MRYTVIIQNYYEQRQGNWPAILEGLVNSSVRPERVIIWSNLPMGKLSQYAPFKITYINASENTLMGRWAASFLVTTPYVFIQDNDLAVRPDTIETMAGLVTPYNIVGTSGLRLNRESEDPYSEGDWNSDKPDVALGRAMFMQANMARHCAIVITDFGHPLRCDDIVASMEGAVRVAIAKTKVLDLPEGGVGLCREKEHWNERNAVSRAMLGRAPVSGTAG